MRHFKNAAAILFNNIIHVVSGDEVVLVVNILVMIPTVDRRLWVVKLAGFLEVTFVYYFHGGRIVHVDVFHTFDLQRLILETLRHLDFVEDIVRRLKCMCLVENVGVCILVDNVVV